MTTPRARILWVVPVFQSVYPKPFGHFMATALSAHAEGAAYEINMFVPERQLLHGAMNQAVDLVLKHDFQAMIVSDDDCTPPWDAIPRLLRHFEAGRPVVAGVGFTRGYPHTTTVGRYFPDGQTLVIDKETGATTIAGYEWLDSIDREPTDLVPCDFCGFPIVIMAADALRTIQAPWFGTELNGGGCTHDVYFGAKCKAAGIPIVVDRTIECGHLGDAPLIGFHDRRVIREFTEGYRKAAQAPQPPGSAA